MPYANMMDVFASRIVEFFKILSRYKFI